MMDRNGNTVTFLSSNITYIYFIFIHMILLLFAYYSYQFAKASFFGENPKSIESLSSQQNVRANDNDEKNDDTSFGEGGAETKFENSSKVDTQHLNVINHIVCWMYLQSESSVKLLSDCWKVNIEKELGKANKDICGVIKFAQDAKFPFEIANMEYDSETSSELVILFTLLSKDFKLIFTGNDGTTKRTFAIPYYEIVGRGCLRTLDEQISIILKLKGAKQCSDIELVEDVFDRTDNHSLKKKKFEELLIKTLCKTTTLTVTEQKTEMIETLQFKSKALPKKQNQPLIKETALDAVANLQSTAPTNFDGYRNIDKSTPSIRNTTLESKGVVIESNADINVVTYKEGEEVVTLVDRHKDSFQKPVETDFDLSEGLHKINGKKSNCIPLVSVSGVEETEKLNETKNLGTDANTKDCNFINENIQNAAENFEISVLCDSIKEAKSDEIELQNLEFENLESNEENKTDDSIPLVITDPEFKNLKSNEYIKTEDSIPLVITNFEFKKLELNEDAITEYSIPLVITDPENENLELNENNKTECSIPLVITDPGFKIKTGYNIPSFETDEFDNNIIKPTGLPSISLIDPDSLENISEDNISSNETEVDATEIHPMHILSNSPFKSSSLPSSRVFNNNDPNLTLVKHLDLSLQGDESKYKKSGLKPLAKSIWRHSFHHIPKDDSPSNKGGLLPNKEFQKNPLRQSVSQVSLGYIPYKTSALLIENEDEDGKLKYYHIPPLTASKGNYSLKGQKIHVYNDHMFVAMHFSNNLPKCNVCKSALRGLGKQGYVCKDCNLITHKNCHCLVESMCRKSNISTLEIEYVGSTFV